MDLLNEKYHKGRVEKLVIMTHSKLIFFLLAILMERQEAGKTAGTKTDLLRYGEKMPVSHE